MKDKDHDRKYAQFFFFFFLSIVTRKDLLPVRKSFYHWKEKKFRRNFFVIFSQNSRRHYRLSKCRRSYINGRRQTDRQNVCNIFFLFFSSSLHLFFFSSISIYIHLDKRENSWLAARLHLDRTIFTSLLIIVSFSMPDFLSHFRSRLQCC